MKNKTKLLLLKIIYHILIALLMLFAVVFIDLKIRPLFHEINFIVILIECLFAYGTIRYFIDVFDEWKHYEKLKRVIIFPECFYPLVIKPYSKMIYGFGALLLLFSVLYLALLLLPEMLGHDWQYSTKEFVGIGLTAILLRAFGNTIISLSVKWNYKTENRKEHTALTLTLINEQRIRYFIYLMFFFALIFFSFIELQMPHSLSHPNEAKAVLSAFGAFLAFDRLLDKTSLISFNPKKHLELLVDVYEKDPKYKGKENYLVDYLKGRIIKA